MKEFLEKLRQQVAENPPNYGDADSVLGLLYECFNENNPYDSEQIKADFEELYRQMNGTQYLKRSFQSFRPVTAPGRKK